MSSSSSVYNELQSCFEPFLVEPRVLSIKLSQTGSNFSINDTLLDSYAKHKEEPFTNNEHDMKSDKNSWSFIQSLSNICNKSEEAESENVYVHPTVKCYSSMLSVKSLEICTENLGCETGSNASDSSDDMSLFSSEFSSTDTHTTEVEVNMRSSNSMSKRLNRSNNFPPPLTSLTELGGVKVRPHREDGRLILEAITSSSPQPYLQAERSNGRLRLRFFESVDDEEEEEEEACDEEEEACDELEITKFGRPSRCNENGKRDIFGDGYFDLPTFSLCL
ncbi:hypothetical protein Lal_00047010 [Lupinus albus]|uniref:Putative The fantastic four family protein n=1 Tax=Lupinus albus TaxID=3870 RepID=A0A6A4QWD5_LUPAL|nr:putative The fantastic four family protein [Lupinus albus]KAF1878343.1 hypothetical protein Lal_00047010 [Lupinus albus]